jgi:hypothetical protein
MGDDDRVVLRSSWGATGSVIVATAIGFWIVAKLAGGPYPGPSFAGPFILGLVLFHWLRRTVVTARGVEVWSFRGTLIPWSQVTGVVVGGRRWNQRYITLQRRPSKPWVRLPAPLAPWGIGSGQLHRARDLIEEMWVRHRNDPAPVDTSANSPQDLWAPPEPP